MSIKRADFTNFFKDIKKAPIQQDMKILGFDPIHIDHMAQMIAGYFEMEDRDKRSFLYEHGIRAGSPIEMLVQLLRTRIFERASNKPVFDYISGNFDQAVALLASIIRQVTDSGIWRDAQLGTPVTNITAKAYARDILGGVMNRSEAQQSHKKQMEELVQRFEQMLTPIQVTPLDGTALAAFGLRDKDIDIGMTRDRLDKAIYQFATSKNDYTKDMATETKMDHVYRLLAMIRNTYIEAFKHSPDKSTIRRSEDSEPVSINSVMKWLGKTPEETEKIARYMFEKGMVSVKDEEGKSKRIEEETEHKPEKSRDIASTMGKARTIAGTIEELRRFLRKPELAAFNDMTQQFMDAQGNFISFLDDKALNDFEKFVTRDTSSKGGADQTKKLEGFNQAITSVKEEVDRLQLSNEDKAYLYDLFNTIDFSMVTPEAYKKEVERHNKDVEEVLKKEIKKLKDNFKGEKNLRIRGSLRYKMDRLIERDIQLSEALQDLKDYDSLHSKKEADPKYLQDIWQKFKDKWSGTEFIPQYLMDAAYDDYGVIDSALDQMSSEVSQIQSDLTKTQDAYVIRNLSPDEKMADEENALLLKKIKNQSDILELNKKRLEAADKFVAMGDKLKPFISKGNDFFRYFDDLVKYYREQYDFKVYDAFEEYIRKLVSNLREFMKSTKSKSLWDATEAKMFKDIRKKKDIGLEQVDKLNDIGETTKDYAFFDENPGKSPTDLVEYVKNSKFFDFLLEKMKSLSDYNEQPIAGPSSADFARILAKLEKIAEMVDNVKPDKLFKKIFDKLVKRAQLPAQFKKRDDILAEREKKKQERAKQKAEKKKTVSEKKAPSKKKKTVSEKKAPSKKKKTVSEKKAPSKKKKTVSETEPVGEPATIKRASYGKISNDLKLKLAESFRKLADVITGAVDESEADIDIGDEVSDYNRKKVVEMKALQKAKQNKNLIIRDISDLEDAIEKGTLINKLPLSGKIIERRISENQPSTLRFTRLPKKTGIPMILDGFFQDPDKVDELMMALQRNGFSFLEAMKDPGGLLSAESKEKPGTVKVDDEEAPEGMSAERLEKYGPNVNEVIAKTLLSGENDLRKYILGNEKLVVKDLRNKINRQLKNYKSNEGTLTKIETELINLKDSKNKLVSLAKFLNDPQPYIRTVLEYNPDAKEEYEKAVALSPEEKHKIRSEELYDQEGMEALKDRYTYRRGMLNSLIPNIKKSEVDKIVDDQKRNKIIQNIGILSKQKNDFYTQHKEEIDTKKKDSPALKEYRDINKTIDDAIKYVDDMDYKSITEGLAHYLDLPVDEVRGRFKTINGIMSYVEKGLTADGALNRDKIELDPNLDMYTAREKLKELLDEYKLPMPDEKPGNEKKKRKHHLQVLEKRKSDIIKNLKEQNKTPEDSREYKSIQIAIESAKRDLELAGKPDRVKEKAYYDRIKDLSSKALDSKESFRKLYDELLSDISKSSVSARDIQKAFNDGIHAAYPSFKYDKIMDAVKAREKDEALGTAMGPNELKKHKDYLDRFIEAKKERIERDRPLIQKMKEQVEAMEREEHEGAGKRDENAEESFQKRKTELLDDFAKAKDIFGGYIRRLNVLERTLDEVEKALKERQERDANIRVQGIDDVEKILNKDYPDIDIDSVITKNQYDYKTDSDEIQHILDIFHKATKDIEHDTREVEIAANILKHQPIKNKTLYLSGLEKRFQKLKKLYRELGKKNFAFNQKINDTVNYDKYKQFLDKLSEPKVRISLMKQVDRFIKKNFGILGDKQVDISNIEKYPEEYNKLKIIHTELVSYRETLKGKIDEIVAMKEELSAINTPEAKRIMGLYDKYIGVYRAAITKINKDLYEFDMNYGKQLKREPGEVSGKASDIEKELSQISNQIGSVSGISQAANKIKSTGFDPNRDKDVVALYTKYRDFLRGAKKISDRLDSLAHFAQVEMTGDEQNSLLRKIESVQSSLRAKNEEFNNFNKAFPQLVRQYHGVIKTAGTGEPVGNEEFDPTTLIKTPDRYFEQIKVNAPADWDIIKALYKKNQDKLRGIRNLAEKQIKNKADYDIEGWINEKGMCSYVKHLQKSIENLKALKNIIVEVDGNIFKIGDASKLFEQLFNKYAKKRGSLVNRQTRLLNTLDSLRATISSLAETLGYNVDEILEKGSLPPIDETKFDGFSENEIKAIMGQFYRDLFSQMMKHWSSMMGQNVIFGERIKPEFTEMYNAFKNLYGVKSNPMISRVINDSQQALRALKELKKKAADMRNAYRGTQMDLSKNKEYQDVLNRIEHLNKLVNKKDSMYRLIGQIVELGSMNTILEGIKNEPEVSDDLKKLIDNRIADNNEKIQAVEEEEGKKAAEEAEKLKEEVKKQFVEEPELGIKPTEILRPAKMASYGKNHPDFNLRILYGSVMQSKIAELIDEDMRKVA